MPLAKPRAGESRSEFVGRCMGDDTMKEEYPEGRQRLGVCFTQWRRKDKAEGAGGWLRGLVELVRDIGRPVRKVADAEWPAEIQAVAFPVGLWTADEARGWLAAHGFEGLEEVREGVMLVFEQGPATAYESLGIVCLMPWGTMSDLRNCSVIAVVGTPGDVGMSNEAAAEIRKALLEAAAEPLLSGSAEADEEAAVIVEAAEDGYIVQVVAFPKSKWTLAHARAWLKEHDFKVPAVDETANAYRFRQRPPEDFVRIRPLCLTPKGAAANLEDCRVLAFGGPLKKALGTDAEPVSKAVPRDVSREVAPEGTAWSAPALKDFTATAWGELSAAQRRRIAGHFAYAATLPPETYGDLKLPHHRPSDGAIVWRGVASAMAVLLGGRGGVDVPAGQRRGVYAHLASHYRQFEKEPPEFRVAAPGAEPEPIELVARIVVDKAEPERRLLYGVVLEPLVPGQDRPDTQGHYYTAEEIEKAAHGFMRKYLRRGRATRHTLEHGGDTRKITMVENAIAHAEFTVGGEPFRQGTWFQVYYVENDELWEAIKAGEYTGLSIKGWADIVPVPSSS